MTTQEKAEHGTAAWFELVGTLMCDAALRADLPSDLNVSLVERYIDGVALSDGFVQGLRFDIIGGMPSFRVGAPQDEGADITIEITSAAARTLNRFRSADPNYRTARDTFLRTGEMRVEGDPRRLGSWLEEIHDPIVDLTK